MTRMPLPAVMLNGISRCFIGYGGSVRPRFVLRWVAFLAVALLVAGCATLRPEVARVPSKAWPHPENTTLGRNAAAKLAASPGDSGFLLLDSGMDALAARGALAELAEHTLDLQYYIVRESATTRLLIYRVLRAAERGVRVRLLVDDLSAAGKELHLDELAVHPNIQVRVFNPFYVRGPLVLPQILEFIASGERLNRRMHNKLWIADSAAAVVGGRNLGDEYFGADPETNFADLDLFAVGPVVQELSRSFDAYWNSESTVPIEAFAASRPSEAQVSQLDAALAQSVDQFRGTPYSQALRDAHFGLQLRQFEIPLAIAPAEAIYDDPAKPVLPGIEVAPSAIAPHLRPHVESAAREVILISPYFIPSERSVATLTGLVRRGVRVRLLTNSLASTDVPAAHAGYARYRERLVAGGVEIHEMRPLSTRQDAKHLFGSSGASLHANAIVVDHHFVVVGSMNLDPRSRRHNTEVALLVDSAELGAQVTQLFEEGVQPAHAYQVELADPDHVDSGLVWITEEDGKPVRYTSEPASLAKRFSAAFLSIFAPEDML